MSEPTLTISLVMGDWSGDGHSRTETVVILSNLDQKAIEAAYKKGSKKLGFDFINQVCEEYEDGQMSKSRLDALVKHGFTIDDFHFKIEYDLEEAAEAFEKAAPEGLSLCTDSYSYIYLFIVKLGNKDFQYKILEGEINPSINIGGYGLFF